MEHDIGSSYAAEGIIPVLAILYSKHQHGKRDLVRQHSGVLTKGAGPARVQLRYNGAHPLIEIAPDIDIDLAGEIGVDLELAGP